MSSGPNQNPHRCPGISRRSFLLDTGMGFTGLALGAMLFKDGMARADSGSDDQSKFSRCRLPQNPLVALQFKRISC